ncbi:MAG: DUF4833 domain-containing protein [Bacteroidota bacterium]|jgi:hypothetical protein
MQFSKTIILLSILLTFNSFAQKNKKTPPAPIEQFPIPQTTPNQLFYIQRSSNINTIIYDANLGADKKLDPKSPVHTYWIRYTDGSKKQELTSIQRSLAYGLHTKPINGELGSYDGYFFAYRKRKFVVKLNPKGEPIALFPINGKMQILKKVFVNVDESGMMPSVIHVELWGRDVVTDKEVYEKFKP